MWQSKHMYTIDWNKFPCFSTFIRHLERRFPVSRLERCPACHPERSEGSGRPSRQILRCAQDDMYYLQMSTPLSPLPQSVQDLAIGHWPTPEAAQPEKLIGSMKLLIHERKAKIHGVGPQYIEEQLADRDASTQSYIIGTLPYTFVSTTSADRLPQWFTGIKYGLAAPGSERTVVRTPGGV